MKKISLLALFIIGQIIITLTIGLLFSDLYPYFDTWKNEMSFQEYTDYTHSYYPVYTILLFLSIFTTTKISAQVQKGYATRYLYWTVGVLVVGWISIIIFSKEINLGSAAFLASSICTITLFFQRNRSQKTTINQKDSNRHDLLSSKNAIDDYNPIAIQNKLSQSIPLVLTILEDDKKVDFLNIYIQVNQNNPFNDDFCKVFTNFKHDVKNRSEQFKRIIDCLDFDLDDLETPEEKLHNYLKTINSPQEVFRMFAVIYAVKGDIKNSKIMLNNSIMAWTKNKIPSQYLHLIRLTEIELLIYTQDFDSLQEVMANYISSFNDFFSKNLEMELLKLKYDSLI